MFLKCLVLNPFETYDQDTEGCCFSLSGKKAVSNEVKNKVSHIFVTTDYFIMAKTKTVYTDEDVLKFIQNFANSEQKKQDSYALIELMKEMSGHEPKMWGPTIVGFGSYHYKYKSGHEGDAPMLGFSPRKGAISLYVFTGLPEHEHLLEGLGKFKMGKACIYVNKLADINIDILKRLMLASMTFLKAKYSRY